jgi:nicotinamidase-related amidase
LRKDRPDWPHPIRAHSIRVPIAALLAKANLVFIIFDVTNPDITGYGANRDTALQLWITGSSLALWRALVVD